jgi:heme exporter protein D
MCCEERSKSLAFYNTLAGGAYVGLAFAIGILAVGIAQVLVRRKAKLEDASDLP